MFVFPGDYVPFTVFSSLRPSIVLEVHILIRFDATQFHFIPQSTTSALSLKKLSKKGAFGPLAREHGGARLHRTARSSGFLLFCFLFLLFCCAIFSRV